jgi:hypothetical protein
LLNYALTVGGIAVATLIPTYIALYAVSSLRTVSLKYVGALGMGLTFWFFYDTMGDAGQLEVNSAIYPFSAFGGVYHFLVILAFVLGIAALAIFDHFAVPNKTAYVGAQSSLEGKTTTKNFSNVKILVFIPIGVAAVMGIHGLGEGWDFGSAAAGVAPSDLVSAFGGYSPLVSYPLHKFFEATIIGIVYLIYVQRSNIAERAKWHVPVLGLLFGLTSVIGATIGYFVPLDTTFFYAFGVTSALYAMIRLAAPLVYPGEAAQIIPSYLGAKTFFALAVGFFLLYIAALLH